MFVKSDFFVYSHLEHSSDEKIKGLHFFSNPLKLWKLTKSKMAAMFPRYYLFHHNFWNNEHKNMYNTSVCIVFKTRKLIAPLFLRNKQFKLDFFYFNQKNIKTEHKFSATCPIGCVLGLERNLGYCGEGSDIWYISPSSGGYPPIGGGALGENWVRCADRVVKPLVLNIHLSPKIYLRIHKFCRKNLSPIQFLA